MKITFVNTISIFVTFFFLFGLNLFFPANIYAETLFFDDFEENNISKWSSINGFWDTVQEDSNFWLHANAPSETDYEIQTGDFSWSDYKLNLQLKSISGVDKNIFFRVQPQRSTSLPGHDLPVSYGIHLTNTLIELHKFQTTTRQKILTASVNIPNNSLVTLSVTLKGNSINIFLNNSTEPIISYEDLTDPLLMGRVGIGLITGASGSEALFDNVKIEHLDSNNLPVPDLKQFSVPWANEQYDHANEWSTIPTIQNFGCALTSATMILNYFGHTVDPSSLNNWLNTEKDGYLRNGQLNWLAVSRYSLLFSNASAQPLEFQKYHYTEEKIDTLLSSKLPVILGMTNHFVVVKGKTSNDYVINDPASQITSLTNLITNRQVNLVDVNVFKPTQTDLSYVLLIFDGDKNLTVQDKDKQQLSSNYIYNLEPIQSDFDNTSSYPKALKAFVYPKPDVDEQLDFEISGQGRYTLDSYFYSQTGEVSTNTVSGFLEKNHPHKYRLEINKQKIVRNIKTYFPPRAQFQYSIAPYPRLLTKYISNTQKKYFTSIIHNLFN